MSLTKKQRELFNYVVSFQRTNKCSPSFDEMRVAIGLASKSGVHRLIAGLIERGYLAKLECRARALTVLRNLDGSLKANVASAPPKVYEAFSKTMIPILQKRWQKFTPGERNLISTALTALGYVVVRFWMEP